MEENKYYIPEISEFFVGFEYEEQYNEKTKFHKNVVNADNCDYPDYDELGHLKWKCECGQVRVKSLDKEDLVELGFKPTYIKEAAELIGGFDMHINEQYKILLFLTGENHVFIFRLLHCDDPSTGRWKTDLFDGKIKNKSELIKVLKMLGIK